MRSACLGTGVYPVPQDGLTLVCGVRTRRAADLARPPQLWLPFLNALSGTAPVSPRRALPGQLRGRPRGARPLASQVLQNPAWSLLAHSRQFPSPAPCPSLLPAASVIIPMTFPTPGHLLLIELAASRAEPSLTFQSPLRLHCLSSPA